MIVRYTWGTSVVNGIVIINVPTVSGALIIIGNGYIQGIQLSQKKPHIARSTGKYKWITPPHIIEAARSTMGDIDLDPASDAKANMTVYARRILTEYDDALDPNTTWYSTGGRVWLNPPYKQPDVRLFAERLLKEIHNGNVIQAIWLSNNTTDTRHGQMLLSASQMVCFTKRIKFLDHDTMLPNNSPLQGQMIIGFGGIDIQKFRKNFNDIGVCLALY